jgi:hypothetical protein
LDCSSPARRPDLPLSSCHLFGPVKVDCAVAILQMTTNRNKVFIISSEIKTGNCTTLIHSILLNDGKNVLKMRETFFKNSLIIAKDE